MALMQPGDGALDYFPCHYGASRLVFRGPRRDLGAGYIAMLGGSETYGRFVTSPFPALVEEALGVNVANLGCQNAGPDVFLADRAVLEVAAQAKLAVVQITGAQNLTNRFYTVHPRRNDRFLAASPLLRNLYRDVDFTEIHFTRHLIRALTDKGPKRFAPVAAELKALWLQRMMVLLKVMPRRKILLWLSDHPPQPAGIEAELGSAPWLVDQQMVDALRPLASAHVEVITSAAAQAEGVDAMRFMPPDEAAAQDLPGAAAHQEAALALLPEVERLL